MANCYPQDRWFAPIRIIENVNDTVKDINGNDVKLTPGLYYNYSGADVVDFNGFSSFFREVELTVSGGTQAANHVSSVLIDAPTGIKSGIQIANGTQIGTQFNPILVSSYGYVVDPVSGTIISSGVSPFSVNYTWQIHKPETHSLDKRRAPKMIFGTAGRQTYVWGQPIYRTIKYQNVPAARVWGERANDEIAAKYAGLKQGDTHQAFENLWAGMAGGDPAIVLHDQIDTVGLSLLASDTALYEIVRMSSEEQRADLRMCLERPDGGHERYNITFDVEVIGGGWAH